MAKQGLVNKLGTALLIGASFMPNSYQDNYLRAEESVAKANSEEESKGSQETEKKQTDSKEAEKYKDVKLFPFPEGEIKDYSFNDLLKLLGEEKVKSFKKSGKLEDYAKAWEQNTKEARSFFCGFYDNDKQIIRLYETIFNLKGYYEKSVRESKEILRDLKYDDILPMAYYINKYREKGIDKIFERLVLSGSISMKEGFDFIKKEMKEEFEKIKKENPEEFKKIFQIITEEEFLKKKEILIEELPKSEINDFKRSLSMGYHDSFSFFTFNKTKINKFRNSFSGMFPWILEDSQILDSENEYFYPEFAMIVANEKLMRILPESQKKIYEEKYRLKALPNFAREESKKSKWQKDYDKYLESDEVKNASKEAAMEMTKAYLEVMARMFQEATK